MNEEYFDWLVHKLGITDEDNEYRYLCIIMQEHVYLYILEMDANRAADGLEYRKKFTDDPEIRAALDEKLGGCTMLELVVSLAEHCAYDMLGSPYEADVKYWFREMLDNIHLNMFDNETLMEDQNAYYEVEDILEGFVLRRFDYFGEGGFFPLQYPNQDQKWTELEIQRNQYLDENYDILGGRT